MKKSKVFNISYAECDGEREHWSDIYVIASSPEQAREYALEHMKAWWVGDSDEDEPGEIDEHGLVWDEWDTSYVKLTGISEERRIEAWDCKANCFRQLVLRIDDEEA